MTRSRLLLRRLTTGLAASLLAACVPRTRPLAAPARIESLAPGITWWRTDDARGPWRMAVVRVDLARRDLTLEAVHAADSLLGRERTSAMARRASERDAVAPVRVAINADFFDLKTGGSENNQVTNGEWWVGRMVTDSPFDTYDNVHSQFALSQDGRGSIARYVLEGRAWARGAAVPILGVNHLPGGTYDASALYTPRFGRATPADSARRDSTVPPPRRRAEVALRRVAMRGDTVIYVVAGTVTKAGGTVIPLDGAVLSTHGDRATAVEGWQPNDTVRVWLGTHPRLHDGRPPQQLLGGWPRILDAGVNVAAEAPIREGTISRNAEARHPRSAIGLSRDGRTMWLLVVDGRSERSVGMTLVELADAMRALGAWDALNFDGGGSTTLVIDGRVMNTPSDATGERAVGNALLVRQRRR